MRHTLTALTTLAAVSATYGQTVPFPNPVPQSDGTALYYVGNNTQYPTIQDAINQAAAGDEIVVRGGTYVESLDITTDGLTIRPYVYNLVTEDTSVSPSTFTQVPAYESVTFINPLGSSGSTWALKVSNASGVHIGRPRQFTEINGLDVQTQISMRDTNYQLVEGMLSDGTSTGNIVPPFTVNEIGATPGSPDRDVFTVQAQQLDHVAIWTDNANATINGCAVSSNSGLGGGIMVTGANQSAFLNCDISGLFSSGATHASGAPVAAVSISGTSAAPTFQNCNIREIDAAGYGAVHQSGGASDWFSCTFGGTGTDHGIDARASAGTYMLSDGSVNMNSCTFESNRSGQGTVYMNHSAGYTGLSRFSRCTFNNNNTVTGITGGVLKVDHASSGSGDLDPTVYFSDCVFTSNNGGNFPSPGDTGQSALEAQGDNMIVTPYVPEYRVGLDNGGTSYVPVTLPDLNSEGGDVNGDGVIDSFDMTDLFDILGMCREDLDDSGSIDFNDLLNVLVNFGNTCE